MRPSHSYDFALSELATLLAIPLVPLGLFALLMHLGPAFALFPPPRAALDTDRTILFHQADAARRAQPASVLLIGDSSCLMDISAEQLSRSLPGSPTVLNLGTLSYLDLRGFAALLSEYTAHHPTPPQRIVLLMHPEALRRPSASEYHTEALDHFYAGTDYCSPGVSPVLCASGVETFRGRFLTRLMPQPLGGGFGREYGFTWDLWDYLSAHHGSAFDPGKFDPADAPGNAEYRLANTLELSSRAFRKAVPKDTEFVIGLTPVPESYVDGAYPALHDRLLKDWSKWLEPKSVLELPAVLPDALFASVAHLNRQGVNEFTQALGRSLIAASQAR